VRKPDGSGSGLETRPSDPLTKSTVASLTEDGGPQLEPDRGLKPGKQQVKLLGPGQRPKDTSA